MCGKTFNTTAMTSFVFDERWFMGQLNLFTWITQAPLMLTKINWDHGMDNQLKSLFCGMQLLIQAVTSMAVKLNRRWS